MPQRPRQTTTLSRNSIQDIANRGGQPDQWIVSPSEWEALRRSLGEAFTGVPTFSVNGQEIGMVSDVKLEYQKDTLKKGRFKGIGY